MKRSNVGRYKGVKAELFNGDSKFGKLSFVSLDHVRVGLSDLLEFSLDALDGLVLDVLHFVKSASDHAKPVGVNIGCTENLINGGFFGIETFLYGLKLLLQDEVSEARLLMHLIDELVEFVPEQLALVLKVGELLEFDFVFPLRLLIVALHYLDVSRYFFQLELDPLMLNLLFLEVILIFPGLLKGKGYILVIVVVLPVILGTGHLLLL